MGVNAACVVMPYRITSTTPIDLSPTPMTFVSSSLRLELGSRVGFGLGLSVYKLVLQVAHLGTLSQSKSLRPKPNRNPNPRSASPWLPAKALTLGPLPWAPLGS